MKIIEFETKKLFSKRGLPIPNGELARTADEAVKIAEFINKPVVLKAQIPIGKRSTLGGISFGNNLSEIARISSTMLNSQIVGRKIEYLLVEEQVETYLETYLSIYYDPKIRRAALYGIHHGGIHVENQVEFVRQYIPLLMPEQKYWGRQFSSKMGFEGQQFLDLASLIEEFIVCFSLWDAILLEINPLILDIRGKWWIGDAKLELDDEAAFRQKELLSQLSLSKEISRPTSEFERIALEIDKKDHRGVAGRLVEFEGELGLLIGGGGASLTIFDALIDQGIRPANYCEIGGNPSVWKVKELTKLILSRPNVKKMAVIMNVVSNTRVDLVARGVIKGIIELGLDPSSTIIAFRLPGSWEEEGKALLDFYKVPFWGRDTSIDQMVEHIKCFLN